MSQSAALLSSKRLNQLCLGGLSALFVATPLVPSESAAEFGTGVIFILLWFLLAAVWLAGSLWWHPKFSVRFGGADLAMAVFLALHTLNGLVMAEHGHARLTVNMIWQWAGLGVCFFLARQLLTDEPARRAICAVMISLSVGLSVCSFHEFFYEMPLIRSEYERDPESVIRRAGIDAAPGSPERELFENRLLSTEPTVTFALTNSLAGFLTPWFVLTAGLGLAAWRYRELNWRTVAGISLCLIAVGFCLLLTKSRTALLSAAFGIGCIVLVAARRGLKIPKRALAVAGGVTVLMIVLALVFGSFDWLVIAETPKSVLYRLQYWQATAAMIGDHFWFGCGPGSFQQYYTTYKLPAASETVADPHNFLLEIWATAGTTAALAFLTIFGIVLWRIFRQMWRDGDQANRQPSGQPTGDVEVSKKAALRKQSPESDSHGATRWIFAGAVVGAFLAYPVGWTVGFPPDATIILPGLPAAAVCGWLLGRWVNAGRLPNWLIWIAGLALLMNLSAAGGIGFPGVSQNVWLLLALALNGLGANADCRQLNRAVAAGLLVASVLALAALHGTMYRPVLVGQTHGIAGANLAAVGRFEEAVAEFRQAADADPFSAQPWVNMASLYFRRWLVQKSEIDEQEFDAAVDQLVRRDPHSQSTFAQIGSWRLVMFRESGRREFLEAARDAFSKRVELYPNSSMAHAQLAWTNHLLGESEPAVREAAEAVRLDQLHEHRERKLAAQPMFDPAPEPPFENVAEAMSWLADQRTGTAK